MRIRGYNRLRWAVRRAQWKRSSGVVILLYHRIADLGSDPFRLAVSPQHFGDHLDMLSGECNPLSLNQLLRCLQEGSLPRKGVVVTFDDGYRDVLFEVKPLLVRHNIPATVFVPSAIVGSSDEFWWDKLERVFMSEPVLPHRLELTISRVRHSWDIPQLKASSSGHSIRWASVPTIRKPIKKTTRLGLLQAVHLRLQPISRSERDEVLQELYAWAGIPTQARETHRVLSQQELSTLVDGGLVEIGAHGAHHVALPGMSGDEQREEAAESRCRLEQMLQRPVYHFSYPHGLSSTDTVRALRAAGFQSACSSRVEVVHGASSVYDLPRLSVLDWSAETLALKLGI